jgi:hypothetical protein
MAMKSSFTVYLPLWLWLSCLVYYTLHWKRRIYVKRSGFASQKGYLPMYRVVRCLFFGVKEQLTHVLIFKLEEEGSAALLHHLL